MNTSSDSSDFLSNLFANKDLVDESVTIKNGIYENKIFDISFKIPDGWNIVCFDTYHEKMREFKFQGILEIAKEKLLTLFDTPFCVVTKYDLESKEYDGIVSPTINFNIIPQDNNSGKMTLDDHADSLTINPEVSPYHFIKGFKVKNKYPINPINGHKGIKIETEYLFENEELKEPVIVEMDVNFIEYGDFLLDFSMSHCHAQNQIATKEFKEVLESIKLKSSCG